MASSVVDWPRESSGPNETIVNYFFPHCNLEKKKEKKRKRSKIVQTAIRPFRDSFFLSRIYDSDARNREIRFCDIGISHFGFEFNRKIKRKKNRNRVYAYVWCEWISNTRSDIEAKKHIRTCVNVRWYIFTKTCMHFVLGQVRSIEKKKTTARSKHVGFVKYYADVSGSLMYRLA